VMPKIKKDTHCRFDTQQQQLSFSPFFQSNQSTWLSLSESTDSAALVAL